MCERERQGETDTERSNIHAIISALGEAGTLLKITRVYVYIYIYTYIHTYMYMYTYIHTYIHIQSIQVK